MKRRIAIAIDLDWPLPHHQGVASGILQYAREKGWVCELDPYLGEAYDGVIGRATREMAAWAARTRTPAVNVWANSPDRTLPRVAPDFRAAGEMVAQHLRDRGLRRLAFLGRERDAAARGLLEGFGKVDALFAPADPRGAAGWRRLQRLLRQWVTSWETPIGVFVSVDLLARYLCDATAKAGLRIPEDVAIVGAGNTELLNNLLEPTLSSVDYGFERVGRRAAELLERLMSGRKPPSAPVLLPPAGIVARRSSDMFAVADPMVSAALRAIWTRSSRPVKVSALLEEVPTSRRTLERRFRETLGRTVHDEIRRAHLERAKKMLVETEEPLKVVASKSGFRDATQFSRVFRGAEGRTPQDYRRDHA
jgi:LacI family transcriptional regulator